MTCTPMLLSLLQPSGSSHIPPSWWHGHLKEYVCPFWLLSGVTDCDFGCNSALTSAGEAHSLQLKFHGNNTCASLIVRLVFHSTSPPPAVIYFEAWFLQYFNETQVAHASLMVARSVEIVWFLVGGGKILKVFMLEQEVGTWEGEMCKLVHSTITFCFGATTHLSPRLSLFTMQPHNVLLKTTGLG